MPKVRPDSEGQSSALQDNGRRAISLEGAENRKPKLTNRGGSGLYGKLKGELILPDEPNVPKLTQAVARHRIAPELQHMAVPIDSLTPDPMNARLHPERNLESIKQSLTQYGQVKPIVVRKATRVVVAGNGTLECAKALGWTEIAAHFVDMNEAEAAGYGIADNKTAELAQWDFRILKALDTLIREAGHHPPIGWTQKELDVLRAVGWREPEEAEDQSAGLGNKYHVLIECDDEAQQIELLERLTQEGYRCRAMVS